MKGDIFKMEKEYGGYLPLELPVWEKEYFSEIPERDFVRLDCGRSAFWYALKIIKPSKLYVPYLNCIYSTDPADALGIPYEYYFLDSDLVPKNIHPKEDEAVIWINYYGNATKEQIIKVKELCSRTNLIVDNCHAFFSKPLEGVYNCYSARKFFGVCDGAYLVKERIPKLELPLSESSNHMHFILSSIERGTNELYPENLKNEERLGKNVKKMSKLSLRILSSINYDKIKSIRKRNLLCLHKNLEKYNSFNVNLESNTHMYYPLLVLKDNIRQKIVERHIYTPTWWKHVPDYFEGEVLEKTLAKYMLMIPIDQRYSEEDMEDISKIIIEEYRRC